ncbi:major facilitator superfamily domain-containing protein [Irpex rosettiformis]|uniref:Major facilitator superfamily domain-containing protein n=1 Tax=Irpex rosettiformis TaxID=378272 RepID=A0ACB8UFL6_9APHY|nr:major facilitator superfamily domain-containing protein [Irpex rosettiformis]
MARAQLLRSISLMIGLIIPVFLETLDYTVVATAQVHIASVFNRLDLQSYIGTIYLLTSTVCLPPFASIADVFGRHCALQLALILFAVGSAISTGAQNMAMMLAGRGIAGMGAAGLLAVVRIILTDSKSLDTNNWQQSMMFLLYTVGYCIGPFIGGALLTVSFRWIFAINLPCCVAGIVLAFFLLRGHTKHGSPSQRLPIVVGQYESFLDKLCRIDWVGAIIFMGGGILLLLALNWGSTGDWDTVKVIVCFVVGGLLFIAFLLWEYYLERIDIKAATTSRLRLLYTDPLIPLDLFKSLNICIVMYATLVSGMVMLVMFYFVAIFFVIVANKSPTNSGAQLIFFAPGMGGGSLLSITLVKRFRQPKFPVVLGGIIAPVSLGLISMAVNHNNEGSIDGFMAMAGIAVGLQIGPLAVQARFSQPASRNAVVSGLLLFFRALGGTIGLAQCGAVLNAKVSHYINDLVNNGTISASDAQTVSLSSNSLSSANGLDDLSPQLQGYVRTAFQQGTRYAFISLIPWAGVALIVTLFLSRISDGDDDSNNAESNDMQQDETRVAEGQSTEKTISNDTPMPERGAYQAPTVVQCPPAPTNMLEDSSRTK